MESDKRAYLELHIAVFLFGLTAILGKVIQLPAISLVWWRVLFTSISLLFFVKFGKKLLTIPRPDILKFLGIGIIVGLHWICFYGSIKLANASVALVCMATTSLFTSIIEPVFTRSRFSRLDLMIGIIVVPAMIFIAQNIAADMFLGFMVGLLAAFLASAFATLNKMMIEKAGSYSITFLEMVSACIFIGLLILAGFGDITLESFIPPTAMDWVYLLILSLMCTTLAYVLSLNALKHITAFASNLAFNMEPVYGILLAAVLLKEYEQLNNDFYVGGFIIVAAVFMYPILKKRIHI